MRLIRLCCAISFLVAAASRGDAQGMPGPGYVELAALRAHPSTMPSALGRRVSFRHTGVPLELALAEIARQAGLGLAYGKDLAVAQRLTEIVIDDLPAADAFARLLDGTRWTMYVSRSGQAVVAPKISQADAGAVAGRLRDAESGQPIPYATVLTVEIGRIATASDSGTYRVADLVPGTYTIVARALGYAQERRSVTVVAGQLTILNITLTKSASQLDQVVVTGTIIPTEVKAVPTPVTVVTADEIAAQHPRTVEDLLRQVVPGAVAWDTPSQPEQTTISVRGSATLDPGTATMKVYLDGVPLADRGTAYVDPASIERIEVIRGPEAASIYGSDAIGGVIQIFTKQGSSPDNRPHIDLQAAAGVAQSPYSGYRTTDRQDYSADIYGSAASMRYSIGGSYKAYGPWVPQGQLSMPSAFGSMGVTQGILSFDVSARYNESDHFAPIPPTLFALGVPSLSKPNNEAVSTGQQTYGAHLTVTPTSWWQNSLTLGVDDDGLDLHKTAPAMTTPSDTFFTIESQDERKVSVALTSAVTRTLTPDISANLTVGVDHYQYNNANTLAIQTLNTLGSLQLGAASPSIDRDVETNTGSFAQTQLAFWDTFFLTGAVRIEENSDFGKALGTVVSPRAGLSVVRAIGPTTVKLRAAYGDAIHPPDPGQKDAAIYATSVVIANPALGPERQRGWDTGLDLTFGPLASLSASYYNQTALNLIQQVQLDSFAPGDIPIYQYQNVARVLNTGVELEATVAPVTALAIKGQYAYTRSRIEDLGPSYTGDELPGDQSLAIPRHTAGASVNVVPLHGTTLVAGLTYTGSWTEYSYIAEIKCLTGQTTCPASFNSTGSTRGFIVPYSSLIRLNVSIYQRLSRGLSAFLSVYNLTNNTDAELTDINPVLGRVTIAGLRFQY